MPENSNTANTRKVYIISCSRKVQKKTGMMNNKTELAYLLKIYKVRRNNRLRLVFTPTFFLCSSCLLCVLQRIRAQSRLLYLLVAVCAMTGYDSSVIRSFQDSE